MKRIRHSLLSLRIFELVACLDNISRAADSVGLTQSAVTKHIQALEEHLGCYLFQRMPSGMRLTPAGLRYLKTVQKALKLLDDAAANLSAPALDSTRVSGEVRLGVAPAFAQRWLLARLGEFQLAYPGILIKLVPRVFSASAIDAAPDAHVQTGSGRFPGFRATYLIGSQLRIVASPVRLNELAMASKPAVTGATPTLSALLSNMPLLTHMLVPKLWDEALKQLHDGLRLLSPERIYFEQYSVLIPAAVGGLGIGLVPECLLSEELRDQKLVCVGEAITSRVGFYLLTPTGRRRSPALQAFAGWLQEQCGAF